MAAKDSFANRLFQAFTGRRGATVDPKSTDLHGKLLAIGGPSTRTKSGIDVNATAKALQVSPHTVRRWLQTDSQGRPVQKPSADAEKRIATRARQAFTTQRGRQTSLKDTGFAQRADGGIRVNVTGVQGPDRADAKYRRLRTTSVELTPDQARAMADAFARHGEAGFKEYVRGTFDRDYLADWGFETWESVDFDDLNGQYLR